MNLYKELAKEMKIFNTTDVSPFHVGYETDPFRNKFISDKGHVYDAIFSNLKVKKTWSLPIEFDPETKEIKDFSNFETFLHLITP